MENQLAAAIALAGITGNPDSLIGTSDGDVWTYDFELERLNRLTFEGLGPRVSAQVFGTEEVYVIGRDGAGLMRLTRGDEGVR